MTAIVAFLTAFFGLVGLIVKTLNDHEATEVTLAKELAHEEQAESADSMARVDAVYAERLRHPGQ